MRTREKDQTSQSGQEFKCGPDRLEMPVRLPNANERHVYRQMQPVKVQTEHLGHSPPMGLFHCPVTSGQYLNKRPQPLEHQNSAAFYTGEFQHHLLSPGLRVTAVSITVLGGDRPSVPNSSWNHQLSQSCPQRARLSLPLAVALIFIQF